MRKGGGQAKGSAFERAICKQLSLWWTQDLDEPRDDVFWRTAGSGARATTRAKKGKGTSGAYGDITFIDPIGKPLLEAMCFELKAGYGSYCALDLVDRKPSKTETMLASFWRQAGESSMQAMQAKDYAGPYTHPAVIFKRNQKVPCIMVSKNLVSELARYAGNGLLFDKEEQGVLRRCIEVNINDLPIRILPLDVFLEYVSPQAVIALNKK